MPLQGVFLPNQPHAPSADGPQHCPEGTKRGSIQIPIGVGRCCSDRRQVTEKGAKGCMDVALCCSTCLDCNVLGGTLPLLCWLAGRHAQEGAAAAAGEGVSSSQAACRTQLPLHIQRCCLVDVAGGGRLAEGVQAPGAAQEERGAGAETGDCRGGATQPAVAEALCCLLHNGRQGTGQWRQVRGLVLVRQWFGRSPCTTLYLHPEELFEAMRLAGGGVRAEILSPSDAVSKLSRQAAATVRSCRPLQRLNDETIRMQEQIVP